MVGRFPACVLNIELNPAQVDVNVHPAKTEVRFANERPVFDLVYYGVKTAIENDTTVKEIQFTENTGFSSSPNSIFNSARQESTYQSKFEFFKKKDEPPVQQVIKTKPSEDFWRVEASKPKYEITEKEDIIEKAETTLPKAEQIPQEEVVIKDEKDYENIIPNFKLIGEAFKTYLIVEIENELYFIDKHAGHERMNYEKFKAQATVETQMLLAPVAVNLTKDEFIAVSENMELIKSCGFELEEFGESQIIVRAIPSLVDNDDVKDLMLEIAQKLLDHKTDIIPDKIDWIYHSASCRGAVKAGDYTSRQEQEMFIKKLLSMPNIRFCPHGRPVFIKMSKYDIEKQFGRV